MYKEAWGKGWEEGREGRGRGKGKGEVGEGGSV